MALIPERVKGMIREHPTIPIILSAVGISLLANIGYDKLTDSSDKTRQPVRPAGLPEETTPAIPATPVAEDETPTLAPQPPRVDTTSTPTVPAIRVPAAAESDAAGTTEATPRPETLPTGMKTSPGFNSYLLNNPIRKAADLLKYHQLVQQTNAENGLAPDFLFDQALSGELDIIPGNTVEDFGHGFSEALWSDLVAMEGRINAAFTETSLAAAQGEFEFQPLVFKAGAFDHPGSLWHTDAATKVETFVYAAHDYDNAMTVMVLAAAGHLENQMGSAAWGNLSETERINLAVDLYKSWILETRETVAPGTPQRIVKDENGNILFNLYFPDADDSYVTCRIEAQPGLDSRAQQQGAPFIRERVNIRFQEENNVETEFLELSRNGDFLEVVIYDPSTGLTRVEVWDLSTGLVNIPGSWQIGQEPQDEYQEGDFVFPMDQCGVAEAPAAPVEFVPPPIQEIPTCEETGTCPPPPPCEETGTCPVTEKSPPGNQTNPDGETEPDPTGGQVIIDGQIDTDGDGTGDIPDNIGSGR